jgi:hypothetical protein
MNAQSAARVATVGLIALMVFQLLLALGLPLGRAALGGQYETLPTELRVSSVVSIAIYAVNILAVRTRAGLRKGSPDSAFAKYGTWFFTGLLFFGALLNAASSSPWERFLWAPFALILSWLCFVVARRKSN